ncbi:MAG: hypothetical protein CSA34_06290 [Desulfobulbus propionicus]|nr:MAG: hypothetical protein CSA34_06290 [Desulfobulbus propionicus]
MECNRLVRLMKDWYLRVKQETMAPVRMMEFVERHIADCAVCQIDPDLSAEVDKIRKFIVPESKIPKAIRDQEDEATPEISPDDKELDNNTDENEDDDLEEEDLDDIDNSL